MLHVETIEPDTLELLKQLQRDPALVDTRLVGGTSLALQLGHRKSVDLDLFGKDIAPMKLEAITNRGSKKDFIDLAFLLNTFTLREMLEGYTAKYPQGSEYLVLRSLVFFDDAEEDPMPVMLKSLGWEEAKARICDAVRATA